MKNFQQTKRTAAKMLLLAVCCIASHLRLSAQTYPPSCVVTAPHSNAYYQEKSDVVINVFASDKGKSSQNGTVTKVEFFIGGNKIGESSTAVDNIYTCKWKCVTPGEYRLTAKATNDKGVSFTSVGQYITVGTQAIAPKGMSANKGKYLANIIPGAAQTKYNTYWNGVTAENSCKWESVERNQNTYTWTGADVSYNHAKDNNMMFRYHAAVWASQYPTWLTSLTTANARAAAVKYMTAIAARYKYIDQIDVLNEQLRDHQKDNQKFRDLFSGKANCSPTDYSWQIWLFEQARAIFPDTKLVLNDYGLENDQSAINLQLGLIKVLRDRGLIDGFGSQAHCFNIDALTAAQLKSSLDLMATGGVPIYITELDLNGRNEDDNSNQAVQKTSYETHFPVFWEHPAVAGVSIWGYITGATWIGGTGIMSSSGTERSALTWLKGYIAAKPNVGYPFNTIPGTCCATAEPTVAKSSYTYKKGEAAVQLSATGTALKWYNEAGTLLNAAPTPSTAAAGKTVYFVTQTLSCESTRASITVNVYEPQAPYGGTPAMIPGTVQFEHYDTGGQDTAYKDASAGTSVSPAPNFRTGDDVDIENCSDTDGGFNIGYATAGEWLEYTVNVAAAGKYSLDLRVACSGDNRTISLSANGVSIAKDVAIPNTTGWQVWQTVTVKDIQLSAGIQVIRVTIGATDYVNLNYMTFNAETAPAATVKLSTGWNLVGCPIQGSTDVNVALSSILPYVLSVKDNESFWNAGYPAFLNQLASMEWGNGYWVKVSAPCELDWTVK